MKTKKLVAVFTVLLSFMTLSCDKTGPAPEIDFHEFGYENSKTALAGDDLHMDADILAENKVDRIEIEIHHDEDEHAHKKSLAELVHSEEWEFDTVYTKFSGIIDPHFHEHIEVPGDAEPGHYHFHFSVTDMEGYQTVFEDEVEILAPTMK